MKLQPYKFEMLCSVALAGVILWLGLQTQLQYVWWRWTSSGLRSIGFFIPLASIYFCWRAWHQPSDDQTASMPFARPTWTAHGVGWGLMLAALGAAHGLQFPVGLVLAAYVSGAVILIGGWAAWRAAWFGLTLLLFVNPVPVFLTALFDARLQGWATRAAELLARGLGMAPRRQGFSLVFASGETMYIAASCNGLRSATAMFYLALTAGYWRHWPWRRMPLLLASALGLAYGLNFLRLAGLVFFHDLAGHWPRISAYEPQVDHGLGGLMFVAGVVALGYWILRHKNSAPVGREQARVAREGGPA